MLFLELMFHFYSAFAPFVKFIFNSVFLFYLCYYIII